MEKLTLENFEEQTKEGLVLVDFFATWCGPCKMLTPILSQVEDEDIGGVKIVKADIDEVEDIARSHGIMSVPTMILFKNGEEVARMVGLRQKTQIVETIKAHL